jgi:hypothetical protein
MRPTKENEEREETFTSKFNQRKDESDPSKKQRNCAVKIFGETNTRGCPHLKY